MNKNVFRATSGLIAAGLALTAVSAQAQIFDFSITSANGDATGTFTTTGGPSTYTVTGVTGDVDGAAITGLSGYGGANNELFEPAPYVSRAGVSFTTGSVDYNIFLNSPTVGYSFCKSTVESACEGGQANGAPVATFTLTAASGTPEPSAWLLMIAGIGGIGFALRRGKRTVDAGFSKSVAA